MSNLLKNLDAAVAAVREAVLEGPAPSVGVVLGSGLGTFAEQLSEKKGISYGDIPGFAVSKVSGHAGKLFAGKCGNTPCMVLQGRVHYYEGHPQESVTFAVRTLVRLGVKRLIITNAAGGLSHPAGTLMLISDHINMLPEHPLRGTNLEALGPRFPDMSEAYSSALREKAKECAGKLGVTLAEGVYAAMQGPSYETPAEIQMLRTIGANAVGMSTVPEVIVANHMGAKVLGISCITNAAAGLGTEPLSHDEVKETASEVRPQFEKLLFSLVQALGESSD